MNRRQFLSTIAAAAVTPALAQQRKPNIVFILADDLGYGDVGCYGQKQIATPNIDRLATEGIRFTNAYAGDAECAPSRCTLMTGLHTGHSRVRANSATTIPLKPEDLTYTEILRKAGYRTALYGKWSLGGLGSTGYPTRKGIDDWFGYFSQLHAQNYYPELLLEGEQEYMLMGNTGRSHKDYTADLFTDRAIRFLEQNQHRPFCLNLCYTIPHSNNAVFRDTGNGMEVPSDAPYSDRPWSAIEKNFAAMVTHLDSDVGKVLDALKRFGLDSNTIVIFTSDNGPHKAGGHSPKFFHSGGPLRGIKFELYEGGIRVPVIVRGPGIAAGTVSDYPWAFWDVLPTLAEIAGAPIPQGIDGISIAPLLYGRKQPAHPYLYWEQYGATFTQAVRLDDWKGIRVGLKGRLELYNLREDLSENNNLAAKNPEMVKKLEAILAQARTESKDYPIDGPRPRGQ
jgi:arylsulfatase A-like enzyme